MTPDCYLCPGNGRADGSRNPDYQGVYFFTNDFSSLLADTAPGSVAPHPLLTAGNGVRAPVVLSASPPGTT